ncbi:MAG: G5 domain-containing protein [Aggregatilineales bacterium]
MKNLLKLLIFITLLAVGCTPEQEVQPILVSLVVDGRVQTYSHTEPITVGQFLREVDVELGPLDRPNPPLVTQISDGIRITVVRVSEETSCENVEIPYRSITNQIDGLAPDEVRVGRSGVNGEEQVCYRTTIVDGEPSERVEIRRNVTVNPQDEIIYVAPTTDLEPVPITGTIAYISNQNVWIMRGSNNARRALTESGNLDDRILSLSADGRQLLFATLPDDSDETILNELWVIADTTVPLPNATQLRVQDVLFAEWVPERANTISYSQGEVHPAAPGWQAFNDLWLMRIDLDTGEALNIEQILDDPNAGPYGWWGMQFEWSPNGERVAWIRADSIGLVNLDEGQLGEPLVSYAALSTFRDWSWRTTVSWSPDSNLIATTVHGPPIGGEDEAASPVFNVAVTSTDGTFNADIVDRAGIWSQPKFSPEITDPSSQYPRGYIAYLQARDWESSITASDYDLVVADRDGSNASIIFPEQGQQGLNSQEFVWSPDGRQIAFIYQDNLWIVDVESGVAHQLTQGGASHPIWTR